MKNSFGFLTALLISFSVGAHEGHKTPGALAAPHGGSVQESTHLYLEMVTEGNTVKLYPMDHDLKPLPLNSVKIEAKKALPRKGKSEKVSFSTREDHFVANIDPQGAHRYRLEIEATYKGKKEKLSFNVEPNQ